QAILALRLISDLILFIFDPTPASGYDVDSQIELYNEIKDNFSKEGQVEILIIFNKMDLAKDSEILYLRKKLNLNENEFFLTNALKGENLELIISELKKRYGN
ncbi:MAG: GTP-binding protein, partial [Candidatus Hodarchaeota archaeon]